MRGISGVFGQFSNVLGEFVRFSGVFGYFSLFSAILGDLQRFWATSDALGTLLGALGRSWEALGRLLGRSWGTLGALRSLLGASWTHLAKKPGCAGTLGAQLGTQNPTKLTQKSFKNRRHKTH